MNQNVLVSEYKPRAIVTMFPSLPFPARTTPSYRTNIEDLQFAVQAGDETIAPALKLLLDEALQLARNSHKLPAQEYQLRLASVKAAFFSVLTMETVNPVARRLQARYRGIHRDDLWAFLKQEQQSSQAASAQTVCSDGNVEKALYFDLKRVFDFILAALLLLFLAPVLLVLVLAIKLDSAGPALFVQERVGVRKRCRSGLVIWEIDTFRFYKFRSMYKDADQSLHKAYVARWINGQAEDSGDSKARYKLSHDPRVTRVGAFLRKTSLDELPQLLNVLKGDMSLVGPRPVPTYEVGHYQQANYERLAALPGMTGLWQVKGRGHVSFEEQVRLDIEYIYRQSLWFDFKLMVLTIPAVLQSRGAK